MPGTFACPVFLDEMRILIKRLYIYFPSLSDFFLLWKEGKYEKMITDKGWRRCLVYFLHVLRVRESRRPESYRFFCVLYFCPLWCVFSFCWCFTFFFLVFFFVARQHIFSLFFFDPYFSTDDFYWFWRKRSMKITFYIKFLRLAVEGSRAGCQMHTKANCRIVGVS